MEPDIEPAAEAARALVVAAGGILQILVVPWAEVEVDGARVGISPPLRPLSLTAGSHVIRLLHPEFAPFQRRVTVRSGETTKLSVDLAKEAFPK